MRNWIPATLFILTVGALEHDKVAKGAHNLLSAAHVGSRPSARAPATVTPLGDAHQGSEVVLAEAGGRRFVYVADEDDAVVHVVDTAGPTELGTVALPGRPGQLLVLPDGRLVVAVRGGSEVVLLRIDPSDVTRLVAERAIATGAEPFGLATTPDGKQLLVTSVWGHSLSIVDVASSRETARLPLPRDPRSVVTSANGKKAFVAHAVGSQISVVEIADPGHSVVASSVDGWSTEDGPRGSFGSRLMFMDESGEFDGPRRAEEKPQPVRHARMACQGFALARLDAPSERVLAPQVQVETGDTSVRSSGYGGGNAMATEMPNVAVLSAETGIADPRSMEVFSTTRAFGESFDPGTPVEHKVRGEAAHTPCVLPRAAVTDRGALYVACLGIDSVVEYDATVVAPERVERRRWHVPKGPVGLSLVGGQLYVWSQFARTLTVLDVERKPVEASDTESATDAVSLSVQAAEAPRLSLSRKVSQAADADVALGRELFHASGDARIAFDGRACASCHPDGRDDSLTWSTPGGPRQTPMLAGRLEDTAPYGWDGAGADVATHLQHTFQRLSGRGLSPEETASLIAYIRTLPVPGQAPATRESAPSVRETLAKGSAIFHSEEAGCSSCHAGKDTLSDGITHDVGSKRSADAPTEFDTPSLRFVAGTAPYFHDGRYASIRDVLTHTDGQMGHTAQLSPVELDALEAYVETL